MLARALRSLVRVERASSAEWHNMLRVPTRPAHVARFVRLPYGIRALKAGENANVSVTRLGGCGRCSAI